MIAESNCSKRNCKHYLGAKNDGDEMTERHYCLAYPDRIPDDIAYGDDKHLTVRPDQNNDIVYEREE